MTNEKTMEAVLGNGIREAEIAVLGSCLADEDALRKAVGMLAPENFGDARHVAIFRRILQEVAAGRPVDCITLGEKMAAETGGPAYLLEIVGMVPSALHVAHYAEIVLRAWAERRLVEACKRVAADPTNEAHREALRRAMADGSQTRRSIVTLGGTMEEYLATLGARVAGHGPAFRTRFPTLDHLLTGGGLLPGQLFLIGARPRCGKSSLLLRLAVQFAKQGHEVLFLSAEMTMLELTDRIVAMESGISLAALAGKSVKVHLERVGAVLEQMKRLPLRISVGGRFTMERVTGDVETSKPAVVFIDYVQLFKAPVGREVSRATFLQEVANDLKALAMTKKVLVVAAAQLNRNVEGREDKVPTLADLKESGGLEEAPDQVLLLHVPAEPGADNRRPGEFILAKQRNGPMGKIPVVFMGDTTSFVERTDEEHNPF